MLHAERICALAFVFAMAIGFSTAARAAPTCRDQTATVIKRALARGDYDTADILKSLKPLPVYLPNGSSTEVCKIRLRADLVEDYLFIDAVHIDDQRLLNNREALAGDHPPHVDLRWDDNGHLLNNNALWIDSDILAGLKRFRRDRKTPLYEGMSIYGPPLLVLICLVALLIVHASGRVARAMIEGRFEGFAANAKRNSVWKIGGVLWNVSGSRFYRAKLYDRSRNLYHYDSTTGFDERLESDRLMRVVRPSIFVVISVVLLLPWGEALRTREPGSPGGFDLKLLVAGGVAFAILIGWEWLYRRGYQWVPGAWVLDAQPQRPGRAEVEGQKAHGDARLATEAEVAAATEQAPRGVSLDDMEF